MPRALLISVRFHDGRYHGRPEWPPSPARLFQALLAGAAKGKSLAVDDRNALIFLERLSPPVIAAPAARAGRSFTNYVPNNDLDSVGGDPRRVADIRAAKFIKPILFDASINLLYSWAFDAGEEHAQWLCAIAEQLHQLGRGIDMAWAWGEIVDAEEIEARLAKHGGVVYRPGAGVGSVLPCPQRGSLVSLERRFIASGGRFESVGKGRRTQQLFSQAARPRFAAVFYDSPPSRLLLDLRETNEKLDFGLWPLARAVAFVEHVRDLAATALMEKRPDAAATVERVFVGRNAKEADKSARIRIVPLPSIGSPHVVPAIRRVLVEVPPDCPFSSGDIEGAFSGLEVSGRVDSQTGEVFETRLLPADDRMMLRHYGIDGNQGYRIWRTVTPAGLPESTARRRIDPQRLRLELAAGRNGASASRKEAKSSGERIDEERRAAAAVVQALRHAGIAARPAAIRVQREPFSSRGARAEDFAPETRFAKELLWHVEIAFAERLRGPLLIGDGRYLGLGLMAPLRDALRDTMVFAVPAEAGVAVADGPALVHAARRALMALARDARGGVPRLFSGHENDGARAASGRHEHVFLAADDDDGDGLIDRLIVVSPWASDRSRKPDHTERRSFDTVVSKLETLRAGRLGIIALGEPTALASDDTLIGPANVWESRTLYVATRHAGRRKDVKAALIRDVASECGRRGLPRPIEIEILECKAVPNGGGLKARARLRFAVAIQGPLLLGRDSHRGGGLFAADG
jgi:CRISPR-associated protein Csb2